MNAGVRCLPDEMRGAGREHVVARRPPPTGEPGSRRRIRIRAREWGNAAGPSRGVRSAVEGDERVMAAAASRGPTREAAEGAGGERGGVRDNHDALAVGPLCVADFAFYLVDIWRLP